MKRREREREREKDIREYTYIELKSNSLNISFQSLDRFILLSSLRQDMTVNMFC